jgi:signal transduction histidine kinase
MELSVALLQMGVKRLQRSILMNDIVPGQTPTELQLVLTQLAALERRCTKAASPMVSTNLADTIMEAACIVGPLARQVGRDIQLHVPQNAIIEGRSDDLRQMFCRMLEHSLAFGDGPIELHVRFVSSDRHDRGEWKLNCSPAHRIFPITCGGIYRRLWGHTVAKHFLFRSRKAAVSGSRFLRSDGQNET